MLKNIDPSNKSIKPFKAYKSFTLSNNDSGSGHFVLKAVSGSTYNFITGSASSQSFGSYVPSASAFEYGTFYDLPNWHTINQLYYKRSSDPHEDPWTTMAKWSYISKPQAGTIQDTKVHKFIHNYEKFNENNINYVNVFVKNTDYGDWNTINSVNGYYYLSLLGGTV